MRLMPDNLKALKENIEKLIHKLEELRLLKVGIKELVHLIGTTVGEDKTFVIGDNIITVTRRKKLSNHPTPDMWDVDIEKSTVL